MPPGVTRRPRSATIQGWVPTPALDDRYWIESGRILFTGVQAVVRLPFDQLRRDRAAGVRTGAFVTGYPGSPLGGYDLALAPARRAGARPSPRAERGDGRNGAHGNPAPRVVGKVDEGGAPMQRAELLVRELGAGTRTVSAAG